jgi:hypothetical protein
VSPAGEDFKASEQAGAEFDEGLEEWHDLVALESPAEVSLFLVNHLERDITL